MIKLIHLFFILFATAGYSQQIPLSFEKMQEFMGDHRIVYVSGWSVSLSIVYGRVLQVKGELADGDKFVAEFDGLMHKTGVWIVGGNMEMCIGKFYCDLDDWGCTGRCEYVLREKKE